LPYIREGGLLGLALVAAGLVIIYTVPRITSAIPAPLVAIVLLTERGSGRWAGSSGRR